MRWSTSSSQLPLLVATLSLGQSVLAQGTRPGAPTEGATSIPVDAPQSEVAGPAAHPGVPTLFLGRQESSAAGAAPATYNDGLYTPWSGDAAASQTPAGETAVAASSVYSIPAVPESSDASVYLQPTASTVIATAATEPATVAPVSTSAAVPTTPPAASSTPEQATQVTSTTELASTSSTSASSSTLSVTSSSRSSATRTASRPFNSLAAESTQDPNSIQVGSSGPKMGVILPVALSLGVLALILLGLLLLVWRRRVKKRQRLNDRRYDGGFLEKGGYGSPSEHGDFDEKDPGAWQNFQRHSGLPYDDVSGNGGMSSGMAGRGAGSATLGQEAYDSDERGWGWGVIPAVGVAAASSGARQARRPLPHTPQQHSVPTLAPAESMSSLHEDLDAMIAQSRTAYEPYVNRPKRENSISNVASAIYSSLSGRSKRYGTRGSVRSVESYRNGNGDGQWNEQGLWEENGAGAAHTERKQTRKAVPALGSVDDGVSSKPLLYTAIDDTPRKGQYTTYTPPDTPTRATPGKQRGSRGDDTDVTVMGDGSSAASMQYSYSDNSPQHVRRFTLRDEPVPMLSPGSPRRTRSKTLASQATGLDSPSCYSPSMYSLASPAQQYPDSLQPGRSPAIGSRAVSPPASTQHVSGLRNPLAQSSKSGTTYSLTGMAGLLYTDEDQQQPAQQQQRQEGGTFTALPPRKPRKQSMLAKNPPRNAAHGRSSPLSGVATASESESTHNPHRAISAVVRASRARGDSFSSDGHGWDRNVRGQLRESHSSSSSVDDLLTNILGPARSPV